MKAKYRIDTCAGDGVGLERSLDDGKTWRNAGYINTDATGSTIKLAEQICGLLNRFEEAIVKECPSSGLGLVIPPEQQCNSNILELCIGCFNASLKRHVVKK